MEIFTSTETMLPRQSGRLQTATSSSIFVLQSADLFFMSIDLKCYVDFQKDLYLQQHTNQIRMMAKVPKRAIFFGTLLYLFLYEQIKSILIVLSFINQSESI